LERAVFEGYEKK